MDFTHGGNVYKVARERSIAIDEIIDFSANINPFGLSKKGEDALKNAWAGVLNYPDPDYVALKSALASFHKCLTTQLFLGNGAIDIIFFMMRALKPKKSLILAPTFVEYERALVSVESHVEFYHLDKQTGFQLEVESFLAQIDGHDCIVLCNPNNPTGQLISKPAIKKILEYAKAHQIRLILDEAFMDFADNDIKQTAVELVSDYENLFILKSITKFFAVPGLRIGYLITNNKSFSNFYQKSKEPWSVNFFAEIYTIHALKDYDYIKKTKTYIREERVRVYKELEKIKDIHPYKSQGNYLFIQYTGNRNIKKELEDLGILIRSCSNYRGLDASYFRMAIKERQLNNRLVKLLEGIDYENEF